MTHNLEQIEAEASEWIRHFLPRVIINLTRVNLLVEATQPPQSGFIQRDILRAAVVLLHATLEDFLRNLAADRLSAIPDRQALAGIPLAGSENKKFELADLIPHRGKTINELLAESIERHLESVSYSNCSQVEALLIKVKIKTEKLKEFFPKLELMIERRHKIVHRADLLAYTGDSIRDAQEIDGRTVLEWEQTVNLFIDRVAGAVLREEFLSKLRAAMGGDSKRANKRLNELFEAVGKEFQR